jgi:hypothetical protein
MICVKFVSTAVTAITAKVKAIMQKKVLGDECI